MVLVPQEDGQTTGGLRGMDKPEELETHFSLLRVPVSRLAPTCSLKLE